MAVVLTDQAWEDLKRDHDKLRGMMHRLAAAGGMRRHEQGQMPDPIWLGKADSGIASSATGTVSIWNGEPGSEADTGQNKEDCYNRSTVTISSGDWCLVREIRRKRYVLPLPTSATRNVVMWSGNTVLEGPSSSSWANDDFGYVKFLGRYGVADAGITFDSTETTPSTNGNMTVTQDGMYLFHLFMQFDMNGGGSWSSGGTDYAEGVFNLRYKRGAAAFANTGISAGNWAAEPYVVGDVDHTAAASGLVPLLADDLLHVRLEGASYSGADPKTFDLESFNFTYERVGEYVAAATA